LTPESLADRLRVAGCVFAEDEARLLIAHAGGVAELPELVRRRCAGVPLEHLLGWAEFRGLRLVVTEGVFVPRPRTEFLVDCVVDRLPASACVLDLCCGCGTVAAAVLADRGDVTAHAVDIDCRALSCARRNLDPRRGAVHLGDLYAALPAALRGTLDVVVANAPYVPSGELGLLSAESRRHETRAAFDGGHDGVEVQRRIVRDAAHWLRPGGQLLLETSKHQAATVLAAVAAAGFTGRTVQDVDRQATVVLARAPTPHGHPRGRSRTVGISGAASDSVQASGKRP
jgi:release factor glutamine methyltransferase